MENKTKKNGQLSKKDSYNTSLKSKGDNKKTGNENKSVSSEYQSNGKSDKKRKNKSASDKESKNLNIQAKYENDGRQNASSLSDFERGYYEGRKSIEDLLRVYGYDGNRTAYDQRSGQIQLSRNDYKRGQYLEQDHQPNYIKSSRNQFGEEYPESLAYPESQGSKKRNLRLGNNDIIATEKNVERLSQNKNREDFSSNRRISEKNKSFENVNQRNDQNKYKRSSFEDQEQTDRGGIRGSETERDYQHEGHQYFGETEGFGNRLGHQHGQDWIEQDEYREGHSQTKRGHGRYGSR